MNGQTDRPASGAGTQGIVRRYAGALARRLGLHREPGPRPATGEVTYVLDGEILRVSGTYESAGRRLVTVAVCTRTGEVLERTGTVDGGHFSALFDLRELRDRLGLHTMRVDLCLETADVEDREEPELVHLGAFVPPEDAGERRTVELDGAEAAVLVSPGGQLYIGYGRSGAERIRVLSARPIAHRGDRIGLSVEVMAYNNSVRSARFVTRGRVVQERIETPARLETVPGDRQRRYRVTAEVDLADVARRLGPSEDTVDFLVELLFDSGRTYEARVVAPSGRRHANYRSVPVTVGNTVALYVPYLTFRAKKLSCRLEHFDPDVFRYMRRLFLVAWLFVLAKPFTGIWLVGEVPYKAQDNGFHFFRYMRTHHPNRRVYYVIDGDSPDRARVEPYGNVVERMSRRHILYSLLASRLVGSHHADYLLASRDRTLTRFSRGVRIFLQHGLTANKNVVMNYGRQGSFERPTECFMVISELEKRIVVEDFGYRPHQVPVVGFARYDALYADDVAVEPVVLVMPTWRDTLATEEIFLASEYFHQWRDFVNSEQVLRLLAEHGLQIKLVLHPNMRRYAEHFESQNVTVIRQEEVDVQRLLKSAALLITDYSSVCWDFCFLRKPVLFFQFDRQMLQGSRAPHIDYWQSLPGPIATSAQNLVDLFARSVEADLRMEERYWQRAQVFLGHGDRNNCERIYRTVKSWWNPRVAFDRLRNYWLTQGVWRRFRRGPWYPRAMRALAALGRALPGRQDVVLFDCDRGRHYGDSPRYLYERLLAREHGLKPVWANNTTLRLLDPGSRKIRRYSPTYWWIASRARYWISNQNFPALVKPSGRTRFLQTWHGTPLKRMQHDVPDMAGRDPDYEKRAARLTSYWSALISPSPYATAAFRSAFRYSGSVLELGYPRNDILSWPDLADRRRLVRGRVGLAGDRRQVILYAPTFRDDNRHGRDWQHDLKLDIDRMAERFGDRYVLLVRFHQLVRSSVAGAAARNPGFVVDVSAYPDVQELLALADVLVTDYSSIFFDYAVVQKPILFFTYDLEKYRDELRGFYMDFEHQAPGPLLQTNGELFDALESIEDVRAAYAERLKEFKQTYCPRDDGGASDRVLDAFFGDAVGPARTPPGREVDDAVVAAGSVKIDSTTREK